MIHTQRTLATPHQSLRRARRSTFTLALSSALALGTLTSAVWAQPYDRVNEDKKNKGNAPTGPAIGMVFVGTNHNTTTDPRQPANQIALCGRHANGALRFGGNFNTGGQGSGPGQRFAGDGLGSSHSVQLTQDRRFLLVTNAGSNNVSVMRVAPGSLQLTDLEPTGNGSRGRRFPNSVTQKGSLVYALNSADQGSITGFRLDDAGELSAIANSTRELAAAQDRFAPDALKNPTQVSFTPDGKYLVVTIKGGPPRGALPGASDQPTGPGRILVFTMGRDGLPSATFTRTDLSNHGPFGFSFDPAGNLLVALFVGGPVVGPHITASAASFRIGANGALAAISRNVPNTQIDSCWLENNGRFAFTSNYSSGTISSYRISGGSLSLLQAVAARTRVPSNSQGSTPLDLGLSPDGRFPYNVLPGSGAVAAWPITGAGGLNAIDEYSGLPQTVDGDHAPRDFSALGSPTGIAVL